jgi:hypothetical protein
MTSGKDTATNKRFQLPKDVNMVQRSCRIMKRDGSRGKIKRKKERKTVSPEESEAQRGSMRRLIDAGRSFLFWMFNSGTSPSVAE